MSIPIIPFIETRPSTTFSLAEVSVQSVKLGVSANVRVLFFTEDKSDIRVKDLVLEQPEYGEWGTDDQFITDWALAQIGVKPAPEPESVPESVPESDPIVIEIVEESTSARTRPCPPCEICESVCGGH
jgi:hypothetical protein